MTLYRIDIKIAATAYIKADTPEAALEVAKDWGRDLCSPVIRAPHHEDAWLGEVPISGRRFNDAALPDASISPAMTILGPTEGAKPEEVEQ